MPADPEGGYLVKTWEYSNILKCFSLNPKDMKTQRSEKFQMQKKNKTPNLMFISVGHFSG